MRIYWREKSSHSGMNIVPEGHQQHALEAFASAFELHFAKPASLPEALSLSGLWRTNKKDRNPSHVWSTKGLWFQQGGSKLTSWTGPLKSPSPPLRRANGPPSQCLHSATPLCTHGPRSQTHNSAVYIITPPLTTAWDVCQLEQAPVSPWVSIWQLLNYAEASAPSQETTGL